MAAASTYTRQRVMDAILRGVALSLPAGTYVSLHTADPGPAGANEVSLAAWPSYSRRDAAAGGAVASGWSATDTNGQTRNAKQIPFPSNNGAAPVTITHFAVWDAITSGNMICYGALTTPRTVGVSEVVLFDVNTLTASLT